MDGILLDAITSRCIRCSQRLTLRSRVLCCYRAPELFSADTAAEVGIFDASGRPMFYHLDCADPTLTGYQMKPLLEYCVRCRKRVETKDVIQAVYGVEDAHAVNPHDPSDKGLKLGERIYFTHVDCGNPRLDSGQGILVLA